MTTEPERDRSDSEDEGKLVAGGRRWPPIVVRFSLVFSLYQTLVAAAQHRTAAVEDASEPAWRSSAERLRPHLIPFGSLSLFEDALALAPTLDQARLELQRRANALTDDIAGAIEDAAAGYSATLWPTHRAELRAALQDLDRLLVPHADALLERLSRDLALPQQPERYDVYLVPTTYQPAGAYSHPTVVSTERFRGPELLEAVVHELAHVMAGLNRFEPGSAFAILKRLCAGAGLARDVPFWLFHVLVFHEGGQLVRNLVPGYVPHALRHDVSASSRSRLHEAVTDERLSHLWSTWVSGERDLTTTLQDLVAHVASVGLA